MKSRISKALLGIAIVVVIIGATYLYFGYTTPRKVFRVYVPAYFLYGLTEQDRAAAYDYVFYSWGERMGIQVEVREFDSEIAMIEQLKTEVQSGNPRVSVVIMTSDAFRIAKSENLLEQYLPGNRSVIPEYLINITDPDFYGTPFEWIPLTFMYDSNYVSLTNVSFDDFVENSTLAEMLMFVDPTVTEPGPQWLLSLIAYYRLKGTNNWTDWVIAVRDKIEIKGTWYDAWLAMISEQKSRYIMTGYLSDAPLTNLWFSVDNFRFAPIYYQGKYYAWFEIGVIAIVKNNPYPELSKKFVEWFLSEPVQRWLPLYNGFLPANRYVFDEVPIAFVKYGVPFDQISPLNVYISHQEIEENLYSWIQQWSELISG